MIHPLTMCALTVAALAAAVVAQPDTRPTSTQSLADQYAALAKRADAAGYGEKVVETFGPEFERFAELHAGTEEALSARLWLLQQTWWSREKGGQDQAKLLVEKLLADSAESKQLAKVAEYQFVFASGEKNGVLERLLAASPHDEVKAAALLALATNEKRSKDDAARKRAMQRLGTLNEKYGKLAYKLTTYGEIANAHLAPIDHADLQIGKTAPDIIGKDVDGKPMKLSDHRGKVVVLDFWGFW